ncbi:hypothetical protein OH76DRAFT_1409052 [Lentinus brumalis]|uniref:F-box domain-containing protein n=1 Tax=Lentinus brumalis TaxID=2498619 RepID=A0A371CW18_9APHY|nr:hypothetical protein OH76DRAFT_1409052 [Polyporus brumalis]
MATDPPNGPYHRLKPSLPGLSREALSSLLAELVKQKEELTEMISSTTAALNALSPVNRLPDELLIDVFLHVQAATRSWPRILVICRRWRTVAHTSARLWSRLDVGTRTPHARITASLKYSGDLPLDVTFDRNVKVSAILDELTPHISRVRALCFVEVSRDEVSSVETFLRNRMPSLRTLHVRFDPYDEDSEYDSDSDFDEREEEMAFCFAPVSGQFPSLEELVLRAVGLRAASAAFPLLKVLQLSDCNDEEMSLQSFVSMLSGLHGLRSLSMRRYHSTRDDGPPQSLPQSLHTLTLEDEEEWTCTYVERLVLPPNLSRLSVSRDAVPDSPAEGLLSTRAISACIPQFPDHPESVRVLLDAVQSVRIDLRDAFNRVSVVGTAGTHTISLAAVARRRCIMRPNPADELVELFSCAQVKDIQIFGIDDEHETTEDDWWNVVCWLRSIKRLAFTVEYGAGDVRDSILWRLGCNLNDADEDYPLVPRDLEELRINAFVDDSEELLEKLSHLLWYRQEHGERLSRLFVAISPRPGRSKTQESNAFPHAKYQATLAPFVGFVHCRTYGKWFADWSYTPPPAPMVDANITQ